MLAFLSSILSWSLFTFYHGSITQWWDKVKIWKPLHLCYLLLIIPIAAWKLIVLWRFGNGGGLCRETWEICTLEDGPRLSDKAPRAHLPRNPLCSCLQGKPVALSVSHAQLILVFLWPVAIMPLGIVSPGSGLPLALFWIIAEVFYSPTVGI